ncbi:MAG TPA: hypothetical protein PK514_05720 [Spirochaetota bacterium]|nr:hypothetical protein [Spirochaetota bacterium]
MKKSAEAALLLSLIFIISLTGCKKKEKSMVDMNSIRTDGSHDDRYIFREEIEKEKAREQQNEKYREPGFK